MGTSSGAISASVGKAGSASSSRARSKPSRSYTNDPVTVSSLSSIRLGSNVGGFDAGAHHDQAPAPAELVEAGLHGHLLARALEHHVVGGRRRCDRAPTADRSPGRPGRSPRRRPGAGPGPGGCAPGSATVTGPSPRVTSAATASAPMGPAPSTSTESPGPISPRVMPCSDTASGSASAAARGSRPVGQAQQRPLVGDDVAGEGAVVVDVLGHRVGPVLALRRLALAGTACTGRSAVTARPPRRRPPTSRSTPVAHGGHHAAPLVALDHAGLAPALEDDVDVGPADAAVAHLDQHLAGPGAGHGPLLDGDLALGRVDGGRHGVG